MAVEQRGWVHLAPNLYVHRGPINVGILRDGQRALLIDVGDGSVGGALAGLGILHVDVVLFTHHHRDQASGVGPFLAEGARVGVPAAERQWFDSVEGYWADPANRWHLYDFRPHHLMLARSIPVHETYREGDRFEWGGATVSVLATPGHTDGSVSYQVDLDGARYIFSGDVLYDEGQVWEVYSLQKGRGTRDYHGFLGDRKRLLKSLEKLRGADAAALIPSHGNIMTNPAQAVDLLRERLALCYRQYVAISALRHYFPGLFREFRLRSRPAVGDEARWPEDMMPVRPGKPCPAFLTHLGTTWIVSSRSGAAFVVDCGSQDVIQGILAMQARGALEAVEWLWISHYHDDHVDGIPRFRETFGCPVVADDSVAQVVENPLTWRLPCISPEVVQVDRRTWNGDSWLWHEFTITAYHLPGQTLYHGGLLVEGQGQRILFVGDSFTMAGIDDYCPGNRNLLGRGRGFDACVALVQALQPDLLLNCHVDDGFQFTEQQCLTMRANLEERMRLFHSLLPWDDPNYGLDEDWVRCYPYEQCAEPGEKVCLQVVFTNHSAEECLASCEVVLPEEWEKLSSSGQDKPECQEAVIPPKAERGILLTFGVPRTAQPGRWVVPVDVTYQGRGLGQFREAILVIGDGLVGGRGLVTNRCELTTHL